MSLVRSSKLLNSQASATNQATSYRRLTPKTRLIPLPPAFITYLREDGILLPDEEASPNDLSPPDESISFSDHTARSPEATSKSSAESDTSSSDSDSDSDSESPDPSAKWPAVHKQIKSTIASLGGSVVPKLNWSAPKDATWISATNTMECRTPNDIYLLLKSSDFVTHDLEHAFDGCADDFSDSESEGDGDDDDAVLETTPEEHTRIYPPSAPLTSSIPYHLTLRATIPSMLPSMEFRAFVRRRALLCICQRDQNYYPFLTHMVPLLRTLIQDFFDANLKTVFPDENFVFDVYIPRPEGNGDGKRSKVWLIDINPWAERTGTGIFEWLEILRMQGPREVEPGSEDDDDTDRSDGESAGNAALEEGAMRISIRDHDRGAILHVDGENEDDSSSTGSLGDEDVEEVFVPEFRLVGRDDPEAYSFNVPQYGAQKLPRDVVDASLAGTGGLREFLEDWREVVRREEERVGVKGRGG